VLYDSVTWPQVALALVAALPGIVAAMLAYLNRLAIKMPSGTAIGTQVEDLNTRQIVTHHNVTRLAAEALERGAAGEAHLTKEIGAVHELVNDRSDRQEARIIELEARLDELRRQGA